MNIKTGMIVIYKLFILDVFKALNFYISTSISFKLWPSEAEALNTQQITVLTPPQTYNNTIIFTSTDP